MLKRSTVEGFPQFKQVLSDLEIPGFFVVYFVSSLDESGVYWCPDCRDAQPVVDKCLEECKQTGMFLTVLVGDKQFWKDKENSFRTEFGISGVPSLVNWHTKSKLVEEACSDEKRVSEFLASN